MKEVVEQCSETDIAAIKNARAIMQYCENMKIAKIAHLMMEWTACLTMRFDSRRKIGICQKLRKFAK